MALYNKLAEKYQSWIESAWEQAEDQDRHTYLKQLPWQSLMLTALETANQEVKQIFMRHTNEEATLADFIDYLKDSIELLERTNVQGDYENDDYFDELSRLWLKNLTEASGLETEAWAIFLSLEHSILTEEVRIFFKLSKLKKEFELLVKGASGPGPELFLPNGKLNPKLFSRTAWSVIQNAAKLAAQNVSDYITPFHLLSAILSASDQVIERNIRTHLPAEVPLANLKEYLHANIPKRNPEANPLIITNQTCSQFLLNKLSLAAREMQKRDVDQLSLLDLLLGLLLNDRSAHQGKIYALFENHKINPDSLLRDLENANRESKDELAVLIPEALMGRDLYWEANQKLIQPKIMPDEPATSLTGFKGIIHKTIRTLFKKKRNSVIITGESGTGRTSLLEQLALELAKTGGEDLGLKKILLFDCAKVAPSQKKTYLQDVLQFAYGKRDVVICLDGLEAIFLGEETLDKLSAAFLDQFQFYLQKNDLQFLVTITPNIYQVSFEKDFRVKKLFEHYRLKEPNQPLTEKILESLTPSWEATYNVKVSKEAIRKACRLTSQYLLSEYFPAKAIQIIEEAADSKAIDVAASTQEIILDMEDVIQSVAKLTGIPDATLRGDTGEDDFEEQLSNRVTGQPEVVKICANELSLIKAGMKNPEKPASVMLFLGMTGTGKTELAKAIANIYSSSKRLVTFTMGNFRESHSVSGLIGAPPGYVGYDAGGPLINEINKDPYCVVLLDEIEKAHPEVWKPFLNLFDEGWIVDQKNVKAYANRSIFILTSNKGAEEIYAIYSNQAENKELPAKEYKRMQEAAMIELNESIHPETKQPCFTPEFLARIQQKMVFRPLDGKSLRKILEILLEKKQKNYKNLRDKELVIVEEVKDLLSLISYILYKDSNGKEGGRVVHKIITEYIDGVIQACPKIEFRRAKVLKIVLAEEASKEIEGFKKQNAYSKSDKDRILQLLEKLKLRTQTETYSQKQLIEKLTQLFEEARSSIEVNKRNVIKDFNKTAQSLAKDYQKLAGKNFPTLNELDELEKLEIKIFEKFTKKESS